MSLMVVIKIIKRFLRSQNTEAVVITGEWGIGKTFTWKKILEENKEQVALEKYAYVSLFGVNSVTDLEAEIFKSIVSKKYIGKEANIETLNDNLNALFSVKPRWWKWRNTLGFIKAIPKIGEFSGLIRELTFFSIKDVMICLDDFERKGKELDILDVLGLISKLKEQRNCKFILIFNQNEFEDYAEIYEKFREKVIDVEIKYDVTPEENIALVFHDDHPLKGKVENFAKALDINNIRILKKFENLANELLEHLDDYNRKVIEQAFSSLMLFVWSFYSKKSSTPDFEFIKKTNVATMYDEADEDENIAKWNNTLREYGLLCVDSFDLVIAEGVEKGYFNMASLEGEAKKLHDTFEAGQSQEDFRKAWGLYHNSFKNNSNELIDALNNSFYKGFRFINPSNLSATSSLLRGLGRESMANEMIDFYIENRKNEKKLFALKDNPFAADIKDKYLIEQFEITHQEQKVHKSLKDILIGMVEHNTWTQEDEEVLSDATSDDYFKCFTSIDDAFLCKIIKAGLGLDEHVNQNVTEALRRIGEQNELNAMRVSRYGIKVDG